MSSNHSRVVQEAADQKMLGGAQQFLARLPAVTLGAQSFAPADIVATFQDRIASSQAVQAAHAARTAAIKADRDRRAQTALVIKSFKRVVQGMFPDSADTLAVFGLQPVRVGARTLVTKATAVDRTLATRKARHTMGKIQKKGIKGVVTSS